MTILDVMKAWYEQSALAQPEIISIYNTQSPLPRYYKMTLTSPECTAAITAAAIKAGCLETVYPECSADEMFTNMTEIPASEATKNDLVFFDWDHNGRMDHVGVAMLVDGDRVVTYEANVGGHRMYRRDFLISQMEKKYGKNAIHFVRPFPKKEESKNSNPVQDFTVTAPSWAVDALKWAVDTGIMQGDSAGLRPHDPLTRAEVAVMLQRFYNLLKED